MEASKQRAALKRELKALSSQVAALEAVAEHNQIMSTGDAASIAELLARLQALKSAHDPASAPTAGAELGRNRGTRVDGDLPGRTCAPYRYPRDSQSVVSWSADAFGKSKTPGWYHTNRKEVFAQRAARAAAQPAGCFISHSKYADEAARVAATGRLAFSSGK